MSSLTPTNAFPNPPVPIPRPPGRAGRSTPRRSSSRSIKRKKFDDELVESSLKKVSKQRGDVVVLEKEIQKRTLVRSGLKIRASSWQSMPASLQGFTSYFHCFKSPYRDDVYQV